MKPTASFKLSKYNKRMIALLPNTQDMRNHFKTMMVEAQLLASVKVKAKGKADKVED